MSIFRWSNRVCPDLDAGFALSLGEGDTPCLPSRTIGPSCGWSNLWFKIESGNPSGSYKDRFAALAISHMRAREEHTCLATSSGNTGAALAAYCAAAAIRCHISVVETAPEAKLRQMRAHGAELEKVPGFGVDARTTAGVFHRLEEQAREPGYALQVSAYRWSPLGMAGVETIAHELREEFPREPLQVVSPAGGGGLTLALACGFTAAGGNAAVHVAQPEGNDTIAGPLRRGEMRACPVACRTTISGLQVADVIDGDAVIAACRESGGTGHSVPDEAVFAVQRRLAREEGIFTEPAGAVALSAALQAFEHGELDPALPTICLVTGSGFKDEASAARMAR